MKPYVKLAVVVLLQLLLGVALCWSQQLSLYGEVTKKYKGKETAAVGYKVLLVRDAKESAPAYTSRTGKYGIYELPGPFGKFLLKVYDGKTLVKSFELVIIKKPTKVDIKLP